MACAIAITSVTGTGPSTGPDVTVSGTAAECAVVEVTLTCGGTSVAATTSVVGGSWSVTFANTSCPCGSTATVEARCAADPACSTTFVGPVDCPACPEVSVVVTIGACTPAGLRTVTFAVTVTPLGGGAVLTQVNFDDAGAGSLATGSTSYAVTHDYPVPGTYAPVVRILLPAGCVDVPLVLPALEACAPQCPTLGLAATIGDCVDTERRRVDFVVTVGGTDPVTCRLMHGDGTSQVAMASPPMPLSLFHEYDVPRAAAAVTVDLPDRPACPPTSITIGPIAGCQPLPPRPPGPIDPITDPPPPDTEEDDESTGCLVTRWVVLGLLAVATFFLLLYICPVTTKPIFGWVAASFGAAGLLAFLAWVLFCSRGYVSCSASRGSRWSSAAQSRHTSAGAVSGFTG